MGAPRIIQAPKQPWEEELYKGIDQITALILQKKIKAKDEERELKSTLKLYREKLELKQKYPDQPSVSISVTPYALSEQIKASQILGVTPKGLSKDKEMKGFTQMGPTTVEGGELGPLGGIQKFFTGAATPRQVPQFTPGFEALRGQAQAVTTGPGRVTQRVTGRGMPGQVLGMGAEAVDEKTLDALKPADIPSTEWSAASSEEKIEFLRAAGLL